MRNRAVRSAVRTYVKKATVALSSGAENASTAVLEAVRSLDKAAQKGVIHPNNAARGKSRLMSRLHLVAAAAPVEAAPATPTRAKRKTTARKTTTARTGTGTSAPSAAARRAAAVRTATRAQAPARKPATRKTAAADEPKDEAKQES